LRCLACKWPRLYPRAALERL
ncbi:hypothetical protein BAE44_0011264, partial [Dichanthelium oligosanthes]